jgi:hypothetical protein
MRTLTTGLALGILSTVALAVPAEASRTAGNAKTADAAQTADPAPTNVKVAWLDAGHTKFRLSWNEVGTVPNLLQWQYSDQNITYTAAAGDPNHLDVTAAGAIEEPSVRLAVYVATPAGEPTSPAGFSARFDTLRTPRPVIDQISQVSPTRFKVKWHPVAATDPNPGDPLDVPPGTPQYQVLANQSWLNSYQPVTTASTATEATFEQRTAPPFKVSVTGTTEWGDSYAPSRGIGYERIASLTIPSAATYGQLTVIRGLVNRIEQTCDPGPCWEQLTKEQPRTVVLQARTNATSPWYVVGTTRTAANGAFSISPPTRGTRQYRVVVPDVFDALGLGLGIASGPATTSAKPRVSASFADPTATYGQRVTARVAIAPPANVRTTLQRWDGKAWRDLKWVNTTNGSGSYTFAATQRGRYAYRFLVPAFTYAGRSLTWQVSPSIVLTTR